MPKLIGWIKDLFTNWLFTPTGAGTAAICWGGVMASLAYFTNGFSLYAPLSYGLVGSLGAIMGLIIVILLMYVWKFASEKMTTNKPTYIEYKVQNGRMDIVYMSNIYKEAYCLVINQQTMILQPQPQPAGRPSLRNQRKQQQKVAQQPVPQQTLIPTPGPQFTNAFLIVNFERMISSQHLKISPQVGTAPNKDNHGMDKRWCHVQLSGITDNSSFRISFN